MVIKIGLKGTLADIALSSVLPSYSRKSFLEKYLGLNHHHDAILNTLNKRQAFYGVMELIPSAYTIADGYMNKNPLEIAIGIGLLLDGTSRFISKEGLIANGIETFRGY